MLKKIFNRRKTDSDRQMIDASICDNDVTIIRKPIKHLYLRVHTDGKIMVSTPKQMPIKTIQAFIERKYTWIVSKQQQLAKRKILLPSDNANELTLFGEKYAISHHSGQGVRKNHIELQGQRAVLYLRKNNNTSIQLSAEKLIKHFYRQQLQTVLNEQAERYQEIIGVTVNEVRIKQMKKKWGTCNIPNKRLWFNLRLATLPLKCNEYIVVHEMTHLLERYHNRRFYRLVEKAMPDWEVWHCYLKQQ